MNKTLAKKIDAFLEVRRKSSGGWPDVSEEDMEQLGEIIRSLIKAKFETDPDGDLPVEFGLTNRQTEMRNPFVEVPYEHKGEFDRYYSRTELNFDLACEAFAQARRMADYRKRDRHAEWPNGRMADYRKREAAEKVAK